MRMFLALLLLPSVSVFPQEREPIIGLPCEGCEAVFDGLPATPASRARIAPASEPGEPMVVVGQVLDARGQAQPGVIVYAYQTNSKGIYPESAAVENAETRRQGRLRAWARTDSQGRYAFDTIRPGGYPSTDIPQHIHLHVIEPGCATYYIDDIMFRDDPRLTPAQILRIARNRGGNGISMPVSNHGIWYVTRNIVLGAGIPGYRGCRS